MLELGCGGGNLASHLDVPEPVLTDLSEDLREPDGATRVVHDPHVCGLFPRATWDRLIAGAGLVHADVAGVADPWPGEHVPMVVRPA